MFVPGQVLGLTRRLLVELVELVPVQTRRVAVRGAKGSQGKEQGVMRLGDGEEGELVMRMWEKQGRAL